MYILVLDMSIYVYTSFLEIFHYFCTSPIYKLKSIICNFYCSVFKVCTLCMKAFGPNTGHHHENLREFRKITICTKCNQLTSNHEHQYCDQSLVISLEEANINFMDLFRIFQIRQFSSK